MPAAPVLVYERRRPEETTLYQVVQENLATLYGAVDDGAVAIALPKFVRKDLEGYLDCGLLCRGFARLRCDGCAETRLVLLGRELPKLSLEEKPISKPPIRALRHATKK